MGGKLLEFAKVVALEKVRLPTAEMVAVEERRMARESLRAMSAQPRMPKRIGSVCDIVVLCCDDKCFAV